MLFSLDRDKSLPGITGMVNETDIVRFVPTSMGETTAGTFELYFDGSDVGLDTTGEDIDALSRTPDGRLVVSMVATYAVPGLAGDDEDLLVFNATSLGENTTGTWERYLDGSDVGLADAADEDIHGTWIDPATGYIYLTTYKYFTTADGLSGDQDDIFVCEPITLGETSACTFHAFWDGDGHGFSDAYITGIHITGLQGGTGVAEVPVIDPIANGDGDGSYTISWNAVADALTYQLEEAPNGADGFWHTLQDAAQTSHAANAPAAGLWCYRVRATYSNRAGDWSLPVCLTTTVGGAAQPLLAQSGPTILYYSKFGQNDIIALDLATDQTTVYFNGLDVGLFIPDINAFHLEADGSILLSLDREIAVPGIAGAVDDSDVLRFVPVTLGATTIGTFEMLLDGSDVGLDGSLDDVVAIGRAPDGRLVISTKGYYDYNIAAWPLDQVLLFNATSLGENTSGSFETYFASGAVNLNDSADENVHGLWIDGPAGELYLINRFTYSLPNGLSGDNNDILRCTVESLGETTSCSSISLFWDGDAHGVGGGLDAIAFSKPRPAPGTLTGQVFLDADYNGQRDGSDTPWANAAITLWTKMGAAASTTTDASGLYSFPAYPGRYEIGVAAQSGYQFAPQNVGDDATDSDVGGNGRSATVVLTSTQVITIDAGLGIPPTPTPTPTPPQSPLPTPPPFSPLPTPTPTPEGYTLPTTRSLLNQCFFTPPPGGIPNEPIIPLSAYSFSAPQEVMTHTAPIGIQQWLPDNETLLITRESLENQLVSVDLVNTSTGVITQVVEPLKYLTEPRWLSLNDTVAWRAVGTLDDMDPGYWEPGYWVRSFEPPWERQLADRGSGASTSHDVSPDGKQLVFMSLPAGTQPLIWNQESQTLDDLPVDLAQWRYKKGLSYPLRPFYPLWHPDGDKILFHDGTWMMLYDLTTNTRCEINMADFASPNNYVRAASWSPNGRYLLIKNSDSPPYTSITGPLNLLLALDTYTGEAVQYVLGNPVANFAWAPDNQTVVMTGGLTDQIDGLSTDGFYLLNVRSGEYQRILPDHATLFGVAHMVEWSPDGSKLAMQCMDRLRDLAGGVFDRICISNVSTNQ